MRINIKIGAISFLLVIFLTTCTYKINDPNVCYTDTVLPILTSHCGGCHSDMLTYDGTLRYVVKYHPLRSQLYKYIKGTTPKMPPDSHDKLTAAQIYCIKAWISMGAKNTSNCSGCDTSQYKFNSDIEPIMKDWCVNCHSSSNAGGGYDLSSYSGVNVAASNGKLVKSIKHLVGASPMPSNGTLPACEISKIQNWVNAGHLNN
jgi:hypothetical protein